MRPTETSRSDTEQNDRDDTELIGPGEIGPQQKTLDFNPIEFSSAERARFLREVAAWSREEEIEDFQQLPGETLREFFAARELHLMSFDTFGPNFSRAPKTSEAWLMLNGQHPEKGRAPPTIASVQLTLPFDAPASDEEAISEKPLPSTEDIL